MHKGKNKWHTIVIQYIFYTVKWSLLSILVGIVVGLAAMFFYRLLSWSVAFVEPLMETSIFFILPVFGLLVSGVITTKLAPEAAGHGTDAIIRAYNKQWGKVSILTVPVKLLASIFTIAFGGSAGPEGPAVQMGGGLAYFVSRVLKLKLTDMRKLAICGMSAAFGSIFTAPIAGGVFGTEILYRDDLEYNNLFMGFLSSITAYYVYSIILGQTRLFEFSPPEGYVFIPSRDILFFIAVGAFVGFISLLFIKSLYGYEHFSSRLDFPPYIKTALGGLLTGITAIIATPYIMGSGIDLVEKLFLEETFPTSLIFLMLLGKIFATSFTAGSGASGGVVAPSLTIGALAGTFISQLVAYPYPLAIISASSVALLGSAAHIPVTTTLLAAETFGMELLKPVTITCFVSSWIAKSDTIVRESYVSRLELTKAPYQFPKKSIDD